MKLLLALYFFILATIQLGLFFGIYHYNRSKNSIKPSSYWMGSLVVSISALLLFGSSILFVGDVAKPQNSFTVANTLFYIAAALQTLFCISLNRPISTLYKRVFGFSAILFLVIFEWMRQSANFEIRTAFMAVIACLFYGWQIIEISIKRRQEPSTQLSYIGYASSAELFFALGRLVIVGISSITIRDVEQIPQILILFTIAQIVMNTLSYIAIGGYWAEKIAIANIQSRHENEQIKSLLQEREALIGSLLRANKTASTGALSASIAHELNQPLGASSLNIQFLQKKLAEGGVDTVLQQEVLRTLLADNQRAANIIRTLRSIFLDDEILLSRVDVGELIDAVLAIARPEATGKHIQIVLQIEAGLMVKANSSEIQQVILNLMNNAMQALMELSSGPRKLSIAVVKLDDMIQISVADNAGGIPSDIQKNLFELLTNAKHSGMGLGLWLCKHIVTRHGGSICYEPNQGGGAKFIVELPAAPV